MPSFKSVGPSKPKLQSGGSRIPPLAIPICTKPGRFRVKQLQLWNDEMRYQKTVNTSLPRF